jgi:hypothetical protein
MLHIEKGVGKVGRTILVRMQIEKKVGKAANLVKRKKY